MIRLVNLGDNTEAEIDLENLRSLRPTGVWLELIDPTVEELRMVAEKSEIPLDFLELPETGNVVNLRLEPDFVVVNFVILRDIFATREADPIVVAFSKDLLITVGERKDEKVFNLAKERMHKSKVDPPSTVASYILDEIISDHFSFLEKVEELTVNLEEEVLEKTDKDTVKRILSIKSRLTSFNKILWYERGVIFNLKKCDAAYVCAKARSLFDTTHEYLTRQIDILDTYREIMSDTINAYLSTISNRINSSIRNLTFVMFYLTIITTITSFPNTVATFFGISQFGNVDYRIIFAAIILSIILPFLWLWRRKYIKLE
jgi:magnesium transporter